MEKTLDGQQATPPNMPDLEQAFRDGLQELWLANRRPDEELPHVSDMTGMCDRLTWARRSGKELAIPSYSSQVNMSLGLHLEPYLLDRLEAGLAKQGWQGQRNVRVVLQMLKNGKLAGMVVPEDYKPTATEIVGHLDFLLIKPPYLLVLDTKTTVWDRAGWTWKAPKDWRHNYKIQTTSYTVPFAVDESIEWSALFEINKAGSDIRTGWVRYQDHIEEVTERFRQVLARTDPAGPEPTVGPNHWTLLDDGSSWACGRAINNKDGSVKIRPAYCEYTGCDQHISQRVKGTKFE